MFTFFDLKSECFAKYDTFCSHIFTYACLRHRLIAIKEVRNYRKIVCIKNIFENSWWENAYSSSYPSGFGSSHKLQRVQRGRMQKPSKESGIFQSLGTVSIVLVHERQELKWGA